MCFVYLLRNENSFCARPSTGVVVEPIIKEREREQIDAAMNLIIIRLTDEHCTVHVIAMKNR